MVNKVIKLNSLVVGYDKPLCSEINVLFDNNKIYGIIGESGKGKSTILKTICGFVRPIKGNVFCDSKDKIYLMNQNYTNFDWMNCYKNVAIARKEESKGEIEYLLERVGLFQHKEKYPSQLSGGMNQRLALARVLYKNPTHILMDEPLSALDEKTRREMQSLIAEFKYRNKNTIIMVTHSLEEAKLLCDKIYEFREEKLYELF